jgi:hypothetical protein
MGNGIIVIGIGGGLFGLGIVGLIIAKRAASRVRVMGATKTSKIAELVPAYEALRAELGGDSSEMAQTVELKGTVECDAPLTGELSAQSAAIVHTRLTRQVEVLRRTQDKQGRTQERWVKQTEELHSNRDESPFFLNDGTGRMRIRPAGAELDLKQVVNRFEQPGAVEQSTSTLSLGSFSFQFSSNVDSGKRVLGYRFQESILAIGAKLYVLGELSDTGEGLAVRDPGRDDRPFIVSTQDEEALTKSNKSSASKGKWLGLSGVVVGVILSAVGVVMTIIGS